MSRWRLPLVPLFVLLQALCSHALEANIHKRQTYAPFSGALYIIYANGASGDYHTCPADAPVACNNIPNQLWCCPSSYVCATAANGLIGCCPNGAQCAGDVDAASVHTSTLVVAGGGGVVPPPATTYVQPVATATTTYNYVATATTTATAVDVYGGYCTTLTMIGPGLPTTAAAQCGTALIVSPSPGRRLEVPGWGAVVVVLPMVVGVAAALGGGLQMARHVTL